MWTGSLPFFDQSNSSKPCGREKTREDDRLLSLTPFCLPLHPPRPTTNLNTPETSDTAWAATTPPRPRRRPCKSHGHRQHRLRLLLTTPVTNNTTTRPASVHRRSR
ncbi:unnamed protein product [Ectocarpus sp. 12 AP-2014]